jgi:tRNA A37 methylthiotransferase MiaB
MGLISLAGAAESDAEINIADINKAINSGLLPMSSQFYDAAAEWLISYGSDMIGFMTEADSYHHLLRICQMIKARQPRIMTLLGGVHATAAHYETLRDFRAVDFIIKGEGENAFRYFIQTLKMSGDLSRVGNLAYRDGEKVISTIGLPLIESLDTLPFPDFSRIELEPQDVIYVEIGRGCPFKCNFCFTAPYWQRKHRIKSPARIMRELTYFKNTYARTDFNFTHDLFTTDRRWVIDFCQQLDESGLDVTWTCSSRTDTLDEEQIYWMQRAGCRDIYFGVETGTDEMQAKIDKNLNLDEAERIIRKSTESGIGATVGFIAGLPGESDFTLRGTLKRAFYFLGLPGATVHLFGFNPYRGSPHFERIKSNLVFDDHFVDFPLSDQMHAENCQLMSSHFEIFSRYSRMASYEGLDVGVIRAADEFFPIINALRSLMLKLAARGVDPLNLLVAWTGWIELKNRERRSPSARLYQGSIADFIDFLSHYLEGQGALDEVTEEIIRWEQLKDIFRSPASPLPSRRPPATQSEVILFTNPSVHTAHFKHTNMFLPDTEARRPGTFAFYAHSDGTPAIVRLEPMSLLILDLAKQGITSDDLLGTIKAVAEVKDEAQPAHGAFLNLLAHLERMDLLLATNQHNPSKLGVNSI